MITPRIVHQRNKYKRTTAGQGKYEQAAIGGKSNITTDSRQISGNCSIALRALILETFFVSGVITTESLTTFILGGWIGILAGILGGVWDMSIAALCQAIRTEETQEEYGSIAALRQAIREKTQEKYGPSPISASHNIYRYLDRLTLVRFSQSYYLFRKSIQNLMPTYPNANL